MAESIVQFGISVVPATEKLDRMVSETKRISFFTDVANLPLRTGGVRGGASRSELPVGYLAGEPLAGPAAWWAETLAGFVDDGFDTLVFWPVDTTPGQVELLAGEVVPQLSGLQPPGRPR
jgi:hypothetical protein